MKLQFYGKAESIYNLIRSYLENRYQKVLLNDKLTQNSISSLGTIKYGVLQGAVLTPLPFFLMYINELPKITNSEIK